MHLVPSCLTTWVAPRQPSARLALLASRLLARAAAALHAAGAGRRCGHLRAHAARRRRPANGQRLGADRHQHGHILRLARGGQQLWDRATSEHQRRRPADGVRADRPGGREPAHPDGRSLQRSGRGCVHRIRDGQPLCRVAGHHTGRKVRAHRAGPPYDHFDYATRYTFSEHEGWRRCFETQRSSPASWGRVPAAPIQSANFTYVHPALAAGPSGELLLFERHLPLNQPRLWADRARGHRLPRPGIDPADATAADLRLLP